MKNQQCCENCKRSQPNMSIACYTMHGYVATLCPTCAYILVDEQNPSRFLALSSRPLDQHTNEQMKRLHTLLSRFILVGVLFVTVIAALAVVQVTDMQHAEIVMEEAEYLSFSNLNNRNDY